MNASELYEQWKPYLHKLALRWYLHATPRDRSSIDAEDVAQEITLHVLERLHTYDPTRGAVSTWITQIARTTASRIRRAQLARKREAVVHHGGDRLAEIADGGRSTSFPD